MNDFEVIPCPFCGSDNVEVVSGSGCLCVECKNCWACGPIGDWREDEAGAVKVWNHRAAMGGAASSRAASPSPAGGTPVPRQEDEA